MRGKSILGTVLAFVLALNMGSVVFAEDAAKEKTPEELALEQEMQAAYDMPIASNQLKGWPQGPSVYAESAIVLDINSGAVLYAKNIDEQRYPASITKIMTALVALENSSLTDKVTFSQDSISFLEYGDAHIGMTPGEEISMEDALYGMMLASANEVAHAIAENAGGFGYDGFIAKMNEKAKDLGCTNSHFVNTNGLHDDNHYVSAHDMALISAAAFKHEEFRTIIKTLEHTIPPTNLVQEPRTFQQNHKMLYPANAYYYENCVGGKTGYTDQAKTTLVTYAESGDMQLVAVNLKSHGVNVYTDTRAMLDYAFGNFKKIPVKDLLKDDKIDSLEDENAYVVIPDSVKYEDLEYKITEDNSDENQTGSRFGTVAYTYNGQAAGNVQVKLSNAFYAKDSLEMRTVTETGQKADKADKKDNKNEEGMSLWVKIVIGVSVAAIVIIILFLVRLTQQRKRQRNRRRRRKNGGTGRR